MCLALGWAESVVANGSRDYAHYVLVAVGLTAVAGSIKGRLSLRAPSAT